MFDVFRLFCSKVIEEKPLGGRLDPPPPFGKGRVKVGDYVLVLQDKTNKLSTRFDSGPFW